ncbi:MAG: AbrB/MazE/SpoVT family DNA-binding domain-containing protein [Thermomicrobiales bacterium]
MKARIIRIGNSRGVRLPKPLLEQTDLTEEVELRVEGSCIVIASATRPRFGWAEAFKTMHARGDDRLLDSENLPPTRFDDKEWEWR